jgi:hypothetical protein
MKVIEEYIFSPQLSNNASNTPNIDFVIISCSQDHFWGPIAA